MLQLRTPALAVALSMASSSCYLSHDRPAHDPPAPDLPAPGRDAGPATPDAPPAEPRVPPAVLLRAPANGATTGSVHAPPGLNDHPLTPLLLWDPTPGALDYQVQLDDSCPIRGFRACAFDSPEVDARTPGISAPSGDALGFRPEVPLPVATEAPVGRRYVWRVRACNAEGCGPWSTPRYLDVGRQQDDLDGDGYADLAAGASEYAAEGVGGAVFIHLSSPDGLPEEPSLVIPNPAPQAYGRFGVSLGAGDFNGDGYADLVVGADGNGTRSGQAFVFLGSASGPRAVPDAVLDPPFEQPTHAFGFQVRAIGDLNGDGFGDVTVFGTTEGDAAPFRGWIAIYDGSEGGVASSPDALRAGHVDSVGTAFGTSHAGAGDLDGDGFVDLVAAAPEVGDGVVYVYPGGPDGVALDPTRSILNPLPTERDHFGIPLALGDLDGDGFAELVVGDMQHSSAGELEGAVYVYRGGRTEAPLARRLDNPLGGRFARFGSALAVSDLDRDGRMDLMVGAYLQDVSAQRDGAAFVYFGAEGSVPAAPDVTLTSPVSVPDGFFGIAVRALDVHGDGLPELAIGGAEHAPPSPRTGAVFVYEAGPARAPLEWVQTLASVADENISFRTLP